MLPVLNRLILDPTIDSVVRAWVANISAGGGSVGAGTIAAADKLVKSLKGAGVWEKTHMLGPCAGDQLVASLVRLKVPSGVAAACTNNNFVSADYTERGSNGGLLGDGSSKYLDTLLNPVTLGWSEASFMAWAYTRTTAALGTSRVTMGSNAAGAKNTLLGLINVGSQETIGVAATNTTQYAVGSATSLTGFLGGGTNGSRVTQFYRNAAAVGGTGTGSDTFANGNIFAHAFNAVGVGAASFNNRRISTLAITSGLSDTEITALYNAVLAFETALGRNV